MKIILKQTLESKNRSIYWLAKETGIAASTLSNIANNKTSSIQFSVLDKICDALNCNVTDIIIPDNQIDKGFIQYNCALNKSDDSFN